MLCTVNTAAIRPAMGKDHCTYSGIIHRYASATCALVSPTVQIAVEVLGHVA